MRGMCWPAGCHGAWRWFLRAGFAILAVLCSLAAGCKKSAEPAGGSEESEGRTSAKVTVTRPQRKTVRRLIEQPGYNIQAYQQTPLYAKVPGYVRTVNVDIGDHVKGPIHDSSGQVVRPGQVLAELWVPEMDVELKQKEAAVLQAQAEVAQARQALGAAEAALKSALAQVKQAEAGRLRARAELARAKSQYERLARAGRGGVISSESVEETQLGYEAAQATVEEVEAKVVSAQALRDESEAKRDKARADVDVARAHLEVAQAARDYTRTLLEYTRIRAPFDGVVTKRQVDVGHFVQPAAGNSVKGEPLFTVDQTDVVRVFVNVPEMDAVWVRDNALARIRVQSLKGQEFKGKVTRASYAFNPQTRTLRTEIDLPSPDGTLRPGMYVHATIVAEHANVWALPESAVATEGEKPYCYLLEGDKAVRTPVRVGLAGDGLVEVLQKRLKPSEPDADGVWENFTGTEEVVAKNLASLKDGQTVTRKKDE